MGRNEPCWCGSGKKYKKCHLKRDVAPKLNAFELTKKAFEDFKRKYCSHPEASRSNCDHIIRAHTITKGLVLKTIAEDGHVYSGKTGFSSFAKNKGKIIPQKIGQNQASTFNGFCGKHDNELFEPIERENIQIGPKSNFLLSYRAVAYENYQKAAELKALEVLKENLDKGLNLRQQISTQTEMNARIKFTRMGLAESKISKSKYDEVLLSGNYDQLNYLAVRMDKKSPVVTSGGHFPSFDCDGKKLFDILEQYSDPPMIIFNLINDGHSALASLAWMRDDTRLAQFAETWLAKLSDRGASFLAQFGIATCENTYYRPSWWEGLNPATQKTLCDAIVSDVDPTVPSWIDAVSREVDIEVSGLVTEIVRHY